MTDLCGCGKPTSHKGMCSARWAKRKENNGPSGLKDSGAGRSRPPMSEEAIARRQFGDLADDILLLRSKGHTVARFRDGYRVDRDVLSYEQVRAMAKANRATRKEITPGEGAADAAKPVTAQAAAPPGACAVCGRTDQERGHTCLIKACPRPTKSHGGQAVVGNGGGGDERSVEHAREGLSVQAVSAKGATSNQHPPAVADPDIIDRLAHIEKRLDQLFIVVADAIAQRRDTLIQQATGLQLLQASLRASARP